MVNPKCSVVICQEICYTHVIEIPYSPNTHFDTFLQLDTWLVLARHLGSDNKHRIGNIVVSFAESSVENRNTSTKTLELRTRKTRVKSRMIAISPWSDCEAIWTIANQLMRT